MCEPQSPKPKWAWIMMVLVLLVLVVGTARLSSFIPPLTKYYMMHLQKDQQPQFPTQILCGTIVSFMRLCHESSVALSLSLLLLYTKTTTEDY